MPLIATGSQGTVFATPLGWIFWTSRILEDLHCRKKKVCEDLDYLRDNKVTLLREGTMTAAELRKSSDELTLKLQQIDAEHQACTETEEETVNFVLKFSKLMKTAPVLFKQATDVERRKMVHLVFTEHVLVDGKIEAAQPPRGWSGF